MRATNVQLNAIRSKLITSTLKDVDLTRNNCVAIKFEENGDISDIRIIKTASKRYLKKVIADFIPRGYIQLRNWQLSKLI